MAQMRAQAKRVATSPTTDDFTLITGIGPAIAARLHNTDILTFAQLAELTPEDLAAIVLERSAKRISSENWTKQARQLASTAEQAQTNEPVKDIRQHYATFTVELLLDEDRSVRRTRVAYIQNELEETWAGWEQSKLTNFFCTKCWIKNSTFRTCLIPFTIACNIA